MTKKEATQKARDFYKSRVLNYLKNNPFDEESIKKYGSLLLKREIKRYRNQVKVVFNTNEHTYKVFHQETGYLT